MAYLRIDGITWLQDIVDKLARKHHVSTHEVEQLFQGRPKFRLLERGKHEGDDVYMALGQTAAGRYLTLVFIYKKTTREALILSARDMARKEKRRYGRGQ